MLHFNESQSQVAHHSAEDNVDHHHTKACKQFQSRRIALERHVMEKQKRKTRRCRTIADSVSIVSVCLLPLKSILADVLHTVEGDVLCGLRAGDIPVVVLIDHKADVSELHVADGVEELPFRIVIESQRRDEEGRVQASDLHGTCQDHTAELDRHEQTANL